MKQQTVKRNIFIADQEFQSPKAKPNVQSRRVPQSLPATEKPNNCTNTSSVQPIQTVKGYQ